MSQKKIRNLNDLAERFGCSSMTVSMALRNSPRLSDKLKEEIQRAARENNFSPRQYHRKKAEKPVREYSHLGPILILHDSFTRGPNPARDQTMPYIFQMLNKFRIEYKYEDIAVVQENPEYFNEFSAVLYYDDQEIPIPEDMPTMQIFGWNELKRNQDRITADDQQVARLATDFFVQAKVRRVAVIWREDMIKQPGGHPRINALTDGLEKLNIPTTPLLFEWHRETNFRGRLEQYIADGDSRVGFFAFNSDCGRKLCNTLESLQLWSEFAPDRVLVCDNDNVFEDFWPKSHSIDLNFPALANRAVGGLLWRLEHPGLPSAIICQTPTLEYENR